MKRCFLHLGMPKTASTSIQATLWGNRALLKKYGWEYPIFRCPQNGHTFFHHNNPLCRLFFEGHPIHVRRDVINGIIDLDIQKKGLFKALDNYCQNTSKLILSSEALLKPHPLKRIKEYMHSQGYAIEPIVYVRSPCSYRVSLYQSLLKFPQFSKAEIIKHFQTPIVRSAVEAPMEIFRDTVKFYPFNKLGRSGVDVVRHFFSHFLDEKGCKSIVIKQDNKSLSWQATSLMEYIEEKSPLYIEKVLSTKRKRDSGDIKPLHQLAGEKFKFTPDQLTLFREVLDLENEWLQESLGKEFCDRSYMQQIASGSLIWGEGSTQSLLNIFQQVPLHIQGIVSSYLEEKAVFSSPALREATICSARKKLNEKKQVWSFFRIMQLFPVDTKIGSLVEKIHKALIK